MPSLSIGWCSCCLYKINIRNWQEGALQRARPTKVAHGQRSGRHEPRMVAGFACAGTENTWCARRTLPHVQFILLIYHASKRRPTVERRYRPNRHHAPNAVAKSACKKAAPPAARLHLRVRRAHQRKIHRRRTFPDVRGRHEMGMGVGCAFDGVEKNGAHGAPYRTLNASC